MPIHNQSALFLRCILISNRHKLVWFENYTDIAEAIAREKQIKPKLSDLNKMKKRFT
ncbi:MAG: hypothetical protein PF517_02605 [Salinivirgaceae bacterium]|jgi:predicted GIY-YIG superfamily endonuclease|nr:hypothetical protein [Salinivirgaceae bacterium]